MASSSQGLPQGTYLDITLNMLAGGNDLNGIPTYKNQLNTHRKAADLTMKSEGSVCTCNSVVLALLAILAAAGCATLLAYSGIPISVDLKLFIPGVLLGTASLGLTIWLIVVIIRSIQHRNAENEKVMNLASGKVSNEKLLAEMHKEETTREHIRCAMKQFTPEQRKELMAWVHKEYFPQNPQPLTENQKKVLSAFADFPADLLDYDIAGANREFVLNILANINPAIINQGEGKGEQLVLELFNKAEIPQNEEEVKIFAKHPIAIAQLAIKPEFTKEIIVELYDLMNVEQKTQFLNKAGDDITDLKILDANPESPTKTGKAQKLIHNKIVGPCIKRTFTREFNEQFVLTENPSQEERTKLEKSTALLQQIARYPTRAAQRIYASNDNRILGDVSMINALYAEMTPGDREAFINHAAVQLNKLNPRNTYHAHCMNDFAQNNTALPEPTQKIFAKTPAAMGFTISRLHSDGATPLALQKADEIFDMMTPEDQAVCLDAKAEYWETEKKNHPQNFAAKMTAMLQAHQAQRDSILETSIPVVYFKRNPQDFREFVLRNVGLGNEAVRGSLALGLLEKMNDRAEAVMKIMDDGYPGYPFFNYLTNMLVDETGLMADRTPRNLATHPVSPSLQKLVARFRFAPQMADSRKKINAFGAAWALKPENAPEWNNFRNIARNKPDDVWRV